MKNIRAVMLVLALTAHTFAQDALPEKTDDVLLNRLQLKKQIEENLDEMQVESAAAGTKSVGKAVVFSALVPGTGQIYAKSYIKAGIFLAAEAIGWTVNITNKKKGDDKTGEFEAYANENWSEQRYWSHVYLELRERDIPNFPNYDEYLDTESDPNKPVLTNWQDAESTLDNYDNTTYLRGYTHQLPLTQTQQYYEMIGKYPEQFGNAWADASYYVDYNGYEGRITAMNDFYTTQRDDANQYYEQAGIGSMVILLNHVLSAVDAGFTTKKYNDRILELTYRQQYNVGEFVNMFGVNVSW